MNARNFEPLSLSGTLKLTLNRPDARNAFSKDMIQALEDRISEIHKESSLRCVLVDSGYPSVFSAGADLKERLNLNAEDTRQTVHRLQSAFHAFSKIPVPTIAVIQGAALGGGAELALACDLRIGSPDAKFAFPETRLGIIPGAGGTQRLSALIGPSRSKDMIFTGRAIGTSNLILLVDISILAAQECLSLGLLNRLSEAPVEEAIKMAEDVCSGGPLAIRLAKRAIDEGYGQALDAGLQIERACYEGTLQTEDRLEGLRAFKAKERPIFKGQ